MAKVRVRIVEIDDSGRDDFWYVRRVGDGQLFRFYESFFTTLGEAAERDWIDIGDVIEVNEEDLR